MYRTQYKRDTGYRWYLIYPEIKDFVVCWCFQESKAQELALDRDTLSHLSERKRKSQLNLPAAASQHSASWVQRKSRVDILECSKEEAKLRCVQMKCIISRAKGRDKGVWETILSKQLKDKKRFYLKYRQLSLRGFAATGLKKIDKFDMTTAKKMCKPWWFMCCLI